jgi:hypothetical protein
VAVVAILIYDRQSLFQTSISAAIIWWVTGNADRSTKIAAQIGQLIGTGFIAYGVVGFFGRGGVGGLWFAFIGYFVIQAAGASLTQLQVGSVLRGLRVRDVMS